MPRHANRATVSTSPSFLGLAEEGSDLIERVERRLRHLDTELRLVLGQARLDDLL